MQHLSVTQRTGTGFTVKADAELATLKGKQACELDGTFSWRVVAKRKDIQGERLAKVLLPPEPQRPNLPAPETPPALKTPDVRRRTQPPARPSPPAA